MQNDLARIIEDLNRVSVKAKELDKVPNLLGIYNNFLKVPFACTMRFVEDNGQIVITDVEGYPENCFGYTREEMIGKRVTDFMYAGNAEKVMETVQMLNDYGFCPKINRHPTKDGGESTIYGVVFKEGRGKYFEMMWKADKVVDYV